MEKNMKSKPILIALAVSALIFSSSVLYSNLTQVQKPIIVTYNSLTKDVKRQVTCLADNIYFESVQEPVYGQKAVAHVTMNRVRSGNYPNNVCSVVQQKTKGVCQFSWFCMEKHLKQRLTIRKSKEYNEILKLAVDVYINYDGGNDVTKGSTFYHADYVNPRWRLQKVKKIGRHIFYRSHLDVSSFERK
jgi:spore germination cell wall hydrolase CwlJ-like protein